MPTLRHLHQHYRRFGRSRQFLYLFCLFVVFWAIFDGLISYLVPNLIQEAGIPLAVMGMIIASSSAWGALFDILIAKNFRRIQYIWLYLALIFVCFLYPLLFYRAQSVFAFALAMMVWGLYYDLFNFGAFNFVSHESPREDHAADFGVITVSRSLGYLLAPLIIGLSLKPVLDTQSLSLMWGLLLIALCFLLILIWRKRNSPRPEPKAIFQDQKISLFSELKHWWQIGRKLWPVLLLTIFLNVWDSFFWTLGPLIGVQLLAHNLDGGLFMAAYQLPALLVGWIVGPLTKKWGKKRTAFGGLLLGSAILTSLLFSWPTLLMLLLVFGASVCVSLSWPSINGAYADYIQESPLVEKEIEGVQDFSTNLGYIIGPLLAGFISQAAGEMRSFSFLGVLGFALAVFLFKVTPRKINLRKMK